MNNLKVLLIVLFIINSKLAFTQTYDINLGVHLNSYFMGDLKSFQNQLNEIIPGSIKEEEFPPFLAYDLSFRLKRGKVLIGAWTMFQSTGARNYYVDATGSLATDIILRGYSVGVSASKNLFNNKIFITGNLGCVYNDLAITQDINIFGANERTNDEYSSINAAVIVCLEYFMRLENPRISIAGQIDGSFFGSDLKSKSNDPAIAIQRRVDWTGFKLGVRIGILKKND